MFDYLVFVNNAKEPIAGFAYSDHALAWAQANYPGKYEVRNVNDEAEAGDNADALQGGSEENANQSNF